MVKIKLLQALSTVPFEFQVLNIFPYLLLLKVYLLILILKESHLHSKYFSKSSKAVNWTTSFCLIYLIRFMLILFMLLTVGGRAMLLNWDEETYISLSDFFNFTRYLSHLPHTIPSLCRRPKWKTTMWKYEFYIS